MIVYCLLLGDPLQSQSCYWCELNELSLELDELLLELCDELLSDELTDDVLLCDEVDVVLTEGELLDEL